MDQFLDEFFRKSPQRKKISEYKLQIQEHKKLSLFYGGLSRKQLKKYFLASTRLSGEFSKNFIGLLERRLDVVLYRSQFFKNISTARQFIVHKKINVNNSVVSLPSYLVKPGDVLSIEKGSHKTVLETRLKFLQDQFPKHSRESLPLFQKGLERTSLCSKNHLKYLARVLIKKTHSRSSLLSYQNPFAKESSKYKYFTIYNENKKTALNSLNHPQSTGHYRREIQKILARISESRLSRNILLGNLEKYFHQKFVNEADRLRTISLVGMKPLHLEISYRRLECIYLYVPQRVYYPFLINFDNLQRASLK